MYCAQILNAGVIFNRAGPKVSAGVPAVFETNVRERLLYSLNSVTVNLDRNGGQRSRGRAVLGLCVFMREARRGVGFVLNAPLASCCKECERNAPETLNIVQRHDVSSSTPTASPQLEPHTPTHTHAHTHTHTQNPGTHCSANASFLLLV